MSDSIQSIRFVPQTNKLNPKGRTGDKKGNKESKKDFSKHMSDEPNGVGETGHNHVKEDCEDTKHKKQDDGNTLPEKKDDDFDNRCGSILDTKI